MALITIGISVYSSGGGEGDLKIITSTIVGLITLITYLFELFFSIK